MKLRLGIRGKSDVNSDGESDEKILRTRFSITQIYDLCEATLKLVALKELHRAAVIPNLCAVRMSEKLLNSYYF